MGEQQHSLTGVRTHAGPVMGGRHRHYLPSLAATTSGRGDAVGHPPAARRPGAECPRRHGAGRAGDAGLHRRPTRRAADGLAAEAGAARNASTALQVAAANRGQAAAWIAQQILPSVLIGCDPLMCQSLAETAGVSASRLSAIQPSVPDPLGVEVIVATPALQSQFGPRLATVYAPLRCWPASAQVRRRSMSVMSCRAGPLPSSSPWPRRNTPASRRASSC